MNLTDNEILELNELCNAVVDGTLTDAQRARLTDWLAASEPAREYYVRAMDLSASLCSYASEMQVEALDAVSPSKIVRLGVGSWLGFLAAAACVVLALWIFSQHPMRNPTTAGLPAD